MYVCMYMPREHTQLICSLVTAFAQGSGAWGANLNRIHSSFSFYRRTSIIAVLFRSRLFLILSYMVHRVLVVSIRRCYWPSIHQSFGQVLRRIEIDVEKAQAYTSKSYLYGTSTTLAFI
jgi:hypothetical protein